MSTAILFPPLMTLKKGSFLDLYEFSHVRNKFKEASDILGYDVAEHFYSEDLNTINQGTIARPSIVTLSTALFEMLESHITTPSYFLGPSLGQVTAIHCSGALGFNETIKMVNKMCELESQINTDDNYGVYFFYNISTPFIKESMENINSKGGFLEECMVATSNQMIVNGDFESLEQLAKDVAKHGGLGVTIPYGPPGHCSLLEGVQEQFKNEFMSTLKTRTPSKPVVSNVSASELTTAADIHNELIGQYTESVKWYQSLSKLWDQGVHKLIVLGPGNFVKKSLEFTDIPFEVETLITVDDIKNKLHIPYEEDV